MADFEQPEQGWAPPMMTPQQQANAERAEREAAYKGEMQMDALMPANIDYDPIASGILGVPDEMSDEELLLERESRYMDEYDAAFQAQPEDYVQEAEEVSPEYIGAAKRWLEDYSAATNDSQRLRVYLDSIRPEEAAYIRSRPRYEQKALMYKMEMNVRDWAKGKQPPKTKGFRYPEKSADEKALERANPKRPSTVPQPFPGLADEVRPKGIEVG